MALFLCNSSSEEVEGDRSLELAGQPALPGQIGELPSLLQSHYPLWPAVPSLSVT